MAKSQSTDVKLERLRLLRDETPSPAVTFELQTYLRDSTNHVAANAAGLAARFRLAELAPDMASAFDRSMADPLKSDKTCSAETAIVDALNENVTIILEFPRHSC